MLQPTQQGCILNHIDRYPIDIHYFCAIGSLMNLNSIFISRGMALSGSMPPLLSSRLFIINKLY